MDSTVEKKIEEVKKRMEECNNVVTYEKEKLDILQWDKEILLGIGFKKCSRDRAMALVECPNVALQIFPDKQLLLYDNQIPKTETEEAEAVTDVKDIHSIAKLRVANEDIKLVEENILHLDNLMKSLQDELSAFENENIQNSFSKMCLSPIS